MKDFRDYRLDLVEFRKHPPFPLTQEQIDLYKQEIKHFQQQQAHAESERETAEKFLQEVRIKAIQVVIHHNPFNFHTHKRYIALDEARKQVSVTAFSARRCRIIVKILKNILIENNKYLST